MTFLSGSFAFLALVVLVVALILGRPSLIGGALALLALLYFTHLLVTGESDLLTLGIVSVALLLVGELCQWSFDSRLPGRYEPGLHLSRGIGLAWLVALAIGVVALGGVAAGLPIPDGIWTVATATAASVALLGLVSAIALKMHSRAESD
jgi:hypothetical protein